MSFLHNVQIGHFDEGESGASAPRLTLQQCRDLLAEFSEQAPPHYNLVVNTELRGDKRRRIGIGSFDGFPVLFKRGFLVCPYLAHKFVDGSIAFVVLLVQKCHCRIYSYDDYKFLTPEEFVPKESLADTMANVAKTLLDEEAGTGREPLSP